MDSSLSNIVDKLQVALASTKDEDMPPPTPPPSPPSNPSSPSRKAPTNPPSFPYQLKSDRFDLALYTHQAMSKAQREGGFDGVEALRAELTKKRRRVQEWMQRARKDAENADAELPRKYRRESKDYQGHHMPSLSRFKTLNLRRKASQAGLDSKNGEVRGNSSPWKKVKE